MEHKLQNPNKFEEINCDQNLKAIFQNDVIDIVSMYELLISHLHDFVEEENDPEEENDSEKKKKKKKSKKKHKQYLSESLAKVCGVHYENRFQVVKLLWIYIKANNLQNPSDKRIILCDDNLKQIFKRDRVHMMTMNKLLSDHLFSESPYAKDFEIVEANDDNNNNNDDDGGDNDNNDNKNEEENEKNDNNDKMEDEEDNDKMEDEEGNNNNINNNIHIKREPNDIREENMNNKEEDDESMNEADKNYPIKSEINNHIKFEK
eukprot:TRINITY_DN2052_c1_g2_i1.p1 TRINITY_DN2052_c1_g2~~TRINITY_DN2052_c1_g2_i1.p1  ORF type:complete len:262 (-),score=99.57 TRINITY_DN2052_c1_g2_i1:32-817(-)